MDKREIIEAQSQMVVMGNKLIETYCYELNVMEQKMLYYMISKIKPTDEPETDYIFNISEFKQVANLYKDSGEYKRYLAETLINMAKKPVVYGKWGKRLLICNWFSSAIIDENTITFTFSKNLTPVLFQLREFFTMFPLEEILCFKSVYSIRLYTYLACIRYKGYKHRITLEELRERVGAAVSYEKYNNLKQWVLEPAIRDINIYTSMRVEYHPIKKGKKIVEIEFVMKKADMEDLLYRDYRIEKELRK